MGSLVNDAGVTVFEGEIVGAGGGVENPLTADLVSDDFPLRGAGLSGADGGSVIASNAFGGAGGSVTAYGGNAPAGQPGGAASLNGGSGDAGNDGGASLNVNGGNGLGVAGRISFYTGGSSGQAGQALVADDQGTVTWGGVQVTNAPPAGPPSWLPFAFDTTAVSGGFYFWNGAAWVKIAAIL